MRSIKNQFSSELSLEQNQREQDFLSILSGLAKGQKKPTEAFINGKAGADELINYAQFLKGI